MKNRSFRYILSRGAKEVGRIKRPAISPPTSIASRGSAIFLPLFLGETCGFLATRLYSKAQPHPRESASSDRVHSALATGDLSDRRFFYSRQSTSVNTRISVRDIYEDYFARGEARMRKCTRYTEKATI